MDAFKELAQEILKEEVQEEGILNRAKIKAKTLGSRFGSSMGKLSTTDEKEKKRYGDNYINEIQKANQESFKKKINKIIKDNLNDYGILFKREYGKRGASESLSELVALLKDDKNIEDITGKMSELFNGYIEDVKKQWESKKLKDGPQKTTEPPADQDQTVNQSTGSGDLSGTKADRSMSGP